MLVVGGGVFSVPGEWKGMETYILPQTLVVFPEEGLPSCQKPCTMGSLRGG